MKRAPWGYILVLLWITFTVSLTGWWIYFGLSRLGELKALGHEETGELFRYQKMFLYEGATLIFTLVLGAVALCYLIGRERAARRRIEEFFATLTHELKTPLAGLRLQAEILKEEFEGDRERTGTIQRLMGSVGRLSLEIENALALSSLARTNSFIQTLRLSEVLRPIESAWPELKIRLMGDAVLEADAKNLESILNNLMQNAVAHGKATEVEVSVREESGKIIIAVQDNGSGFRGDRRLLGKLFVRHYEGSGTGIGLHLVRLLAEKMGGTIRFLSNGSGFGVELILKGAS